MALDRIRKMVPGREQNTEDSCVFCDEDDDAKLEQHHKVPQRFGGPDSEDNLVTVCRNCHATLEDEYDNTFWSKVSEGVSRQSDKDADGIEVEPKKTPDRRLTDDCPHVKIIPEGRRLEGRFKPEMAIELEDRCPIDEIIHCAYCNEVFRSFEQAKAARHLREKHNIADPHDYTVTAPAGGLSESEDLMSPYVQDIFRDATE